MIVSTFGYDLDRLTVVINCDYRMNHWGAIATTKNGLAGWIFNRSKNACGCEPIPTVKLLELITRYPGAIPSILNNLRDPNQALHGQRERKRERSLPLLLSLLLSFVRILHRAHVRVINLVRLRAKRNLSPDPRDRKLMTANHRRDLSIPIHRPDGAWSTIPLHISAGFPGSRAAAVPPSRYHFGIRRIDSTLVRRLLRCLDVSTAEAIVRGCISVFGYTRAHAVLRHRSESRLSTGSNG